MDIKYNFLGGWDEWQDKQFNAERLANMYLDMDEDGKRPVSAVVRSGHAPLVQLPAGNVIRNLSVQKEALYAVSSADAYKLDNSFNPVHINSGMSLLTSLGYIGIAANANNEILFTDGAAGYLYRNASSSFGQITETNFPANPTVCAVLDGYFIVNKAGTNENYVSAENNGLNWTLDSAARRFLLTAETDIVVAYALLGSNLYVFGKLVAEVWSNLGLPGAVPFRRNRALTVNYGCAAVKSVDVGHGVLAWLSSTSDGIGSIMMTDGGQVTAISTKALDDVIQTYTKVDDAEGYIYQKDGHLFYNISFPTPSKTWCYDFNTKLWSEVYELGGARYTASCHAYFAGKHIIGDYKSRTLYELKGHQDNGAAIPYLRISKHLSSDTYKRIQLNKFQIDMLSGNAKANGIDAKPDIFFSISRDGGITYAPAQRKIYTQQGQYNSRTIYYIRGIARTLTLKLEGYTSLQTRILGAALDMQELST